MPSTDGVTSYKDDLKTSCNCDKKLSLNSLEFKYIAILDVTCLLLSRWPTFSSTGLRESRSLCSRWSPPKRSCYPAISRWKFLIFLLWNDIKFLRYLLPTKQKLYFSLFCTNPYFESSGLLKLLCLETPNLTHFRAYLITWIEIIKFVNF